MLATTNDVSLIKFKYLDPQNNLKFTIFPLHVVRGFPNILMIFHARFYELFQQMFAQTRKNLLRF